MSGLFPAVRRFLCWLNEHASGGTFHGVYWDGRVWRCKKCGGVVP
jgi:hypothetical protein